MRLEHKRQERVAETIAAVKKACGDGAVTRETLKRIESILLELARDDHLFPEGEFGIPPGEKIRLYRLSEDEDGGFALYLHAANVPAEVAPHNHTTWACIAGIGGEELNFFYETEDGSAPLQSGTRPVRKGEAVSLMPDDVHSIRAAGNEPLKNLHLYGKAIDQLFDRVFWNASTEEWTTMPPTSGIIERRAA